MAIRIRRRGENVSQNDVNQLAAPRTNFAATTPRLMFQAHPVFFEFEKLFISSEDFGRPLFSGDNELVFGARQDFLEMLRSRHCRS
jgi:hypothetical protein